MDVLSEACTEMNGVLASGTCVDEHTSDQLLIYMALERYFNAPPKKNNLRPQLDPLVQSS